MAMDSETDSALALCLGLVFGEVFFLLRLFEQRFMQDLHLN